MNWQEQRVLVTGAGGFMGSHLVEKLISLKASVKAFVRYNSKGTCGFIDTFAPQTREKLEIVQGDLRDPEAVRNACKDVDVVFHLGALVAIPYSYVHPVEVVETNVLGTLNVLTAARDSEVGKIIHTSSSEVYGTAQYVPIDEKHPLCGQSPYSASKIGADQLAESFHRSFELPVAIIRPFNTYGPRQSARAVIPSVITQVISRGMVYIGATHPTRDLTYVADTVEGFIKIAECPEALGKVTNVGSGKEVSIRQLVDKICTVIGKKAEIIFDPARLRPGKSEVEQLVADTGRMKEITGWQPSVSLDEGLQKTVDWISDHFSLYRPEAYAI
ncbi:MAG: NAD-dependent dehydratase [Latescibacteria bacterium DG_63]|nr:MAG: NAD-dependent dehydratase [Latescibacteria bacterium DG_63]